MREGPRLTRWSRASYTDPASCRTPDSALLIVTLGVKRATAAATARSVGILEGETGSLHRRDVVDVDPVQILSGKRITEYANAFLLQYKIVFGSLFLDEKAVLEAAATAGLDADAKAALCLGHAFGSHELLDLDRRHRRDVDHEKRLLGGSHVNTSLISNPDSVAQINGCVIRS